MSPLSISWHFVETQGAITCHNFPQNGSLFLPVKILQKNKDLLILKLQLLFLITSKLQNLFITYKYLSSEVYEHWLSSYGPATALILTHKIPLIKIQARKICHWIFLNKLLFVETILYFTYKADGRSENLGGGEGKL